jgi:8-oxo-dGTP pyrophosphatase MutT (NUDIX family)
MDFKNDILRYIPQNEREEQDKKVFTRCLEVFSHDILSRENEIAHITSSGFIVNEALDKILMLHHNIRDTWAWAGGHADGDGDLLAVAVREALEETGLRAKPLSSEIASLDVLAARGHVRRGRYVSSHLHLSIAYILVADDKEALTVQPDENSAVEWFPAERISEDVFTATDANLYSKLLQRAKELVKHQERQGRRAL